VFVCGCIGGGSGSIGRDGVSVDQEDWPQSRLEWEEESRFGAL